MSSDRVQQLDWTKHPHRRYNALTGEWVLVSPQRTQRPWQGQQEDTSDDNRPAYQPDCYLCPGNERANGQINPNYDKTFVFTNDFPSLMPDTPKHAERNDPFFRRQSVTGTSRVVCFSPRHDLTLAEMPGDEIRAVIDVCADQSAELGEEYRWVQIFENKGELMGCSNPHPHGQIWACNEIPNEPMRESRQQGLYLDRHKSVLLLDYLKSEKNINERLVLENEHWAVVVPFWAVWPFETLLLPTDHVTALSDLSDDQRSALSEILKKLLVRYDNLFDVSFPYTMGWHGRSYAGDRVSHWQLHAHFYPPLLRSATIRKFMVGYEMLAEAQRDITPEQAAQHLRSLPDVHYKRRK